MKNLFLLAVLVSATVLAIGFASADCIQNTTTVFGTVYVGNTASGVNGAQVNVTCNSNEQDSVTNSSGGYDVNFGPSCNVGSTVTVTAQSGSSTGQNASTVTFLTFVPTGEICGINLNVAIVNVPLVPEFGLTMGIMTVLSAITAFFVIKRR